MTGYRGWLAWSAWGRLLRGKSPTGPPPTWNRVFGDRGEREAARFLRAKGLRVITRGYRTSRGEIDLIARDGDTLVFVEVKTRKMGTPAEAVTAEKRRRITRAALHFAKRHGLLAAGVRCRFDVVAIVWPDAESGGRPRVDHVPSAFEAEEGGPSPRRS